jgi:hypothetical protein
LILKISEKQKIKLPFESQSHCLAALCLLQKQKSLLAEGALGVSLRRQAKMLTELLWLIPLCPQLLGFDLSSQNEHPCFAVQAL